MADKVTDELFVTVRRTSKLPTAPDEHMVRLRNGIHAIPAPVEEDRHVGGLRASGAPVLSRVHHRSQ